MPDLSLQLCKVGSRHGQGTGETLCSMPRNTHSQVLRGHCTRVLLGIRPRALCKFELALEEERGVGRGGRETCAKKDGVPTLVKSPGCFDVLHVHVRKAPCTCTAVQGGTGRR